MARASYQTSDDLIDSVVSSGLDEAGLVKLGAWAALLGEQRCTLPAGAPLQAARDHHPELREELLGSFPDLLAEFRAIWPRRSHGCYRPQKERPIKS